MYLFIDCCLRLALFEIKYGLDLCELCIIQGVICR